MTQPAAGWYPDPSDPSRQRYFDGTAWTDNYAPFGPPAPAAQTAPKPGMSRGLKVGLAAGAVLVVGVGLLNSGDAEKATGSTSGPSAQAAPSPRSSPSAGSDLRPAKDPDVPAPAGSAVRDGKFEFQVLGVERGATSIDDAFGPEIAKGEFFTVRIRVTNVGDDARSFSATNQKLIINGNEYEATSLLDNGWMEDINPGLGIDTQVTFDIPKGAVPTAIEFHDSMFSGGATVAL